MKNIFIIIFLIAIKPVIAGNNYIIFASDFEMILMKLNDTGVTWSGDYPNGNNTDCLNTASPDQDCHQGRDASHFDNSDGHAGFSYTKLNFNGDSLSANTGFWDCVKDNVTGLVWEVKKNSGLHDKNDWYNWGGITAIGLNNPNSQGVYHNDWDELVNGSNDEKLCGATNWRVPTISELHTLSNHAVSNPTIDINYFPNTQPESYWSSSPYARNSSNAWYFHFENGLGTNGSRNLSSHVRLVHFK